MIAVLTAALIDSARMQSPPHCHIPKHALVAGTDTAPLNYGIAIFDRDTGKQTCNVAIPSGNPPGISVAPDGRIFVVVHMSGTGEDVTDMGHLDVIGPDGRLLRRMFDDATGVSSAEADSAGHLFVSTGAGGIVHNTSTPTPGRLTMYEARTLRLIRRFDVPATTFYGVFAISPDGKWLAALISEYADDPHVDIFNTATGARAQRLTFTKGGAPSWIVFDGGDLLLRMGGTKAWQRRSPTSGAILATPEMDGWRPPKVFHGIMYRDRDASEGVHKTAQGFETDTLIERRAIATHRTLPPIAIRGALFGFAPVDPDPALAAVPDASARRPHATSLAQLRASLPAHAVGVQFRDAASGKHFIYAGDYARIDDDRTKHFVIVDCVRGTAIVADAAARRFRVLRIDPTTIDAQPAPDAFTLHVQPPASASLTYRTVPRFEWHSASATAGYSRRFVYDNPPGPAYVEEQETEYADVGPAAHPSCARHTFEGAALEIEPGQHFDPLSPAYMRMQYEPGVAHIDGTPPMLSRNAMLVHFESHDTVKTKRTVDISEISKFDATELGVFLPPDGYAEDRSIRY